MRFYLKYKIGKISRKLVRNKRFRTYDEISRVIILFNAENINDMIQVVESLENEGKTVKAYCFDKKDFIKRELPKAFRILKKKDLSCLGVPKDAVIGEYRRFEADTVMDMTRITSLVMTYLFFCSEADYKVGFRKGYESFYDLLLEADANCDFPFFSDKLLFYMKNIRGN